MLSDLLNGLKSLVRYSFSLFLTSAICSPRFLDCLLFWRGFFDFMTSTRDRSEFVLVGL